MTEPQMPLYQCHKRVRALQIKKADITRGSGTRVTFEDARFPERLLAPDFPGGKHVTAGGYLVVYEDGYESYSPAEAFEKGYTLIEERAGGWCEGCE